MLVLYKYKSHENLQLRKNKIVINEINYLTRNQFKHLTLTLLGNTLLAINNNYFHPDRVKSKL